MKPRTDLLALACAAVLLGGCAPATAPLSPAREIALSRGAIDVAERALAPEPEAAPSAAVSTAPVHWSEIEEAAVTAPDSPAAAAAAPATGHTPGNHDAPQRAHEKKVERSAPKYWPQADDRLLELIGKDLDKAVEPGRPRPRLQFSKAVIDNPRVRHYLAQFSKEQKEHLAKTLSRSGRYFQMISEILGAEGLPEELAYLALVESNFSTTAKSPSGAVGLWQFIPSTARQYGLKIDPWVDERRDPIKSTRAAAAYLKDLHAYFDRWYLATAAYNAGQGAIERAMQKSGAKDYWALSRKNHLSEETRNFVPKFVAVTLIAQNPEKYGFADIAYDAPLAYEEVEVRRPLMLDRVAAMSGVDVEALRELNPSLLRDSTPPHENFRLRVPFGAGTAFAKAYEQTEKEIEHVRIVTHQVRRGETLLSIARRYGQEVRALMRLNSLSGPRLKIGQRLMIIVEKLRGGLK
ncbi:MAG TPA: transglycosylase SLT domain-containing protein [Candidatus Eisenbacteria bacterium]|nr:transglycosylase SLT domain-containing protein [Candidatus Eisenbacteria bacterium]